MEQDKCISLLTICVSLKQSGRKKKYDLLEFKKCEYTDSKRNKDRSTSAENETILVLR